MEYVETYDFYATSKEDAEDKMEEIIKNHYVKYGKRLRIQNLWLINDNLWRCDLVY